MLQLWHFPAYLYISRLTFSKQTKTMTPCMGLSQVILLQELISRWDSERKQTFLRRHRTFRGQRLRPL